MFSLQSQHTDDSVTWDFVARRELDAGGAPEMPSAQSRAADVVSREERCGAVYEEGLKNLNTGNGTETKRHQLLLNTLNDVMISVSIQKNSTYTNLSVALTFLSFKL